MLAGVESLLAAPPNQKAAELARDAFESTIKGFAVGTVSLTAESARKKIGHDLTILVQECAAAVPASGRDRINGAAALYPRVGARCERRALPTRRLWECYCEAQRAMAISLRILEGEAIP